MKGQLREYISFILMDLKQLRREPVLLLFAVLPLFMVGLFFWILGWGFDLAMAYIDISFDAYLPMVVVLTYLILPMLFGTVMAFLILDDRDQNILSLLQVTPLGLVGYLKHRFGLVMVMTVPYFFFVFMAYGHRFHSFLSGMIILIFLLLEVLITGGFVALLSEDKVKGLTYAKATGILILFGFTPWIPLDWLKYISWLVPHYYVGLIIWQSSLYSGLMGLFVHLIWLLMIIHLGRKYMLRR